jgi:hypothetical protein
LGVVVCTLCAIAFLGCGDDEQGAPQPPALSVSPEVVSFNAVEGGADPASQIVTVTNAGGSTLAWSAAEAPNVSWLSLTNSSGGNGDAVTLNAATGLLAVGTYNTTVEIADPNATNTPRTLAVSLTVDPFVPKPAFSLSAASLTFSGVRLDPNPADQEIQLGNGGDGGTTLDWTVSSDSGWLSITPDNGTTTVEVDTLTVSVDTTGLAAGTHDGELTFTDPAASNNPRTVAVELTLTPEGPFTEMEAGFVALMATGSAWGDFDGDGDLDLATSGATAWSVSARRTILYRNNGDDTFTKLAENLTKVASSYAAWGDLENDGDIDLALTGSEGSHMYNDCASEVWANNGSGALSYAGISFGSQREGAMVWGDYDNDGRQDLFVFGEPAFQVYTGRLFHNDGGSFTNAGVSLPAFAPSYPSVGDYDCDGDMDILANSDDNLTVVCRNMGGGVFSQVDTLSLSEYRSACFVDIDNDGDLDISAGGKIYIYDSGSFTYTTSLSLAWEKAAAWGDYDNDGDIDVVTTNRIYYNDGSGSFSSTSVSLFSKTKGEIVCGDYDNDGDLDIAVFGSPTGDPFATLYRNNCAVSNDPPSLPFPAGLSSVVVGSDVTLSWAEALDDHTPPAGLSYNIRVGTTSGAGDIVSGMARSDGQRLIPALGNAQKNLSWKVKGLDPGTYHWSVQAIDTCYLGSPWAEEAQFVIPGPSDPPTVSTAASASPDPVTADQTTLSVLGDDDSGEATLTYTWATTGTPPEPVTFSENGTNAAKTTVATFTMAGNYSFEVTIEDIHSQTVTDTVDVTVDQTLTSISVSPATADVTVGEQEQFTASAKDQYDDTMTATFTWSVGAAAGTIDTDGLFTASMTAGGPYAVTASSGIVNGTADVNVIATAPTITSTAPTEAFVGEPYVYVITATGSPAPSITVSGLPGWLTFDDVDTISGTPQITDVGTETITATATNVVSDDTEVFDLEIMVMPFTDLGVTLPAIQGYCAAWGDYDNDGDLDLAFNGYDGGAGRTKLCENDALTFTDVGANLPGLGEGPVVWGDYDRDGEVDLALAGWSGGGTGTAVSRNDGGLFTTIGGFRGMKQSDAGWGDYDNDGDLDLVVAGESYDTGMANYARLYRNNGASFSDVGGFLGVRFASVAWGDYDGDGDLDLALTGRVNNTPSLTAKLYRNDAGSFTEVTPPYPAVESGDLAWGDYDADGDLDLAFCGYTGSSRLTTIYENLGGGSLVDSGIVLPGITGDLDWGDFDNDGDFDMLLSGGDGSTSMTHVYRNDGGTDFVLVAADLPPAGARRVAWGDVDGDGDLDIAITGDTRAIYLNNASVANTPPSAPENPAAVMSGSDVIFSWDPVLGDETPSAGLTYNLRVGTMPGGEDIMASMSDLATGWRKVAEMGNVGLHTSWTLKNLAPGVYYWSVQAVDNAFAGSPWAPEQLLVVTVPGLPEIHVHDGASVGVADLFFECTEGQGDPLGQSFWIENVGDVGTILAWSAIDDVTTPDWLAYSPDSGELAQSASVEVPVSIDASGLLHGEYTGIIAISGTERDSGVPVPSGGTTVTVHLTVHDSPLPRVVALDPAPGSSFVEKPDSIVATFNRDIDALTLDDTSFLLTGSGGDGTFVDGNEVAIVADGIDLSPAKVATMDLGTVALPEDTYQITLVGTGSFPIQDTTGQDLDGEFSGLLPSGNYVEGGDFVATFKVDATGPRVSGMTPAPDEEVDAEPTAITVTFNEEMDEATVNEDTFRLVASGGDGTFDDGNEVVIDPDLVSLVSPTMAEIDLTTAIMSDEVYRLSLSEHGSPAGGLVAHWKLDEASDWTAHDSAGVSNGTLTNMLGTEWTTGYIDGGLSFIDSNDVILVDPVVDIGAEWTISAWFTAPLPPTGTWHTLTRGSSVDHQVIINGSLELGVFANGNGDFRACGYNVGGLASGWHHLAAVGSGTTTAFYIDGLSVGASDRKSTSNVYGVGNMLSGGQRFADTLDDVRIYGRALATDEVVRLVRGGVRDLAGNVLDGEFSGALPSGNGAPGGDFVADFTVEALAPTVVSTSPVDGTGNVDVSATITVTFSERMDKIAAENAFSVVPGVAGTFSWSEHAMTFTPALAFATDETYTVTVTIAATDFSGKPLAAQCQFSFDTTDTIAPQVAGMLPVPATVEGTAPTQIVVTFDEPMDESTLTTDSFTLLASGGDETFGDGNEIPVAPDSVVCVGNQATMSISAGLDDEVYQVTVGSVPYTGSGLVAHWKFDESGGATVMDSSTSGYNGALNGPERVPGRVGSGALHFTGTDSYVQIGAPNLPVPWTAALWVKREDSPLSLAELMYGHPYMIRLEQWSGSNRVGITHWGTSDPNFGYTAPVDEWTHLALTADASGTTLYANGAPAGSVSLTIPCPMDQIGHSGESMSGDLDDVRVYDRLLTSEEIAALASEPLPVTDLAGHALDGEFSGGFPSGDGSSGGAFIATFSVNAVSPTVTTTWPMDTDTDVSELAPVYITFSEPMDRASAEAAFSMGGVTGTFEWIGSTMVFIPSAPLAAETGYAVSVDVGASDFDGTPMAVAYGFSFTTGVATAVPSGLLARWRLDETTGVVAHDATANLNDGTLVGGLTWTPGRLDGSLSFDGTDDYVDCGNPAAFDLTTAVSVTAWVCPAAGSGLRPIASKGDHQYTLRQSSSGTFEFLAYDGAWHIATGTTVADVGRWYHVAGVCDGATVKVYVDGVEEASVSGGLSASAFPVNIGRNSEETDRLFGGRIDEVRIYDRAMTGAEVIELAGGFDRGLLSHWKLDESNGDTAFDATGNGIHGTIFGNSVWQDAGGKVDGAVEFDGTGDGVQYLSKSDTSITFSAWIDITAEGQSTTPRIVQTPAYSLAIWSTDGDVVFEAGWTSLGRWTVSQALIGTGWRHVAVTYDGSSTANDPAIYIDGATQTVAEAIAPTGTLADNAGAGVIGNRALFYDRNFAGRIDDVRIHDRVLDAIEIQALFDAGNP